MNTENRSVCPGCKRHCPASSPCCKYGKKYFSQPAEEKKAPKWSRGLDRQGPICSLLSTARSIKRAIKEDHLDEPAFISCLSSSDVEQLTAILKKLDRRLIIEK